MKEQMILHTAKIKAFVTVCVLLSSVHAVAQEVKYILPLGNSITLGKSNFTSPTQSAADHTTHGYRGYLYNAVHTAIPGFTIEFTGPSSGDVLNTGISPYKGWFQNGAVISDFHGPYNGKPGGSRDVIAQLNNMTHYPDIVLLHIGTNDIGKIGEQESKTYIGHYNTPGTVMHNLKVLMHQLLEWRGSGGEEIEQVFLCKIIPKAPLSEFPGLNANVQDYNLKIEKLLNEDLEPNYTGKVKIVDMYSPFYATQGSYYTADNDPLTIDDHLHPSRQGYEAMANQYADYLIDYLSPEIRNEFVYNPGGLDSQPRWNASANILVHDVGEAPGGALYSSATGGHWNNVAIWDTTYSLNSASIRIHPNTTNDPGITSGVGLLVGMSSKNVNDPIASARPGGYFVFVHPDGRVDAYIYDGKDVGNEIKAKVGAANFPTLSPGDKLTVIYEKETDHNALYVTVNDGNGVSIRPTIQLLNDNNNYYSGIVFRGNGEGQSLLVDYFEVDNKRLDLIPPAKIDLEVLAAAATNSSVTLQWTAVGDDGGVLSEKSASSYDLRYSMSRILTDDNFDNANIVSNVAPPEQPGALESKTIKGLLSGVTYYFAIKAVDDYGNKGPLSQDLPAATTNERTSMEDFANLKKWKYNPNEYAISDNEITNVLEDTHRWGDIAVYKGVKNPKMVKMVWGENAVNPSSGTENGGIIMLASDTSLTASGYMILVRTLYNKIYLFHTYWNDGTNQRDFNFLDGVTLDRQGLGGVPGANDTLAVVVDNSEDAFVKFDVYASIGGNSLKPASKISLYDTRLQSQRPDPEDDHYAGLILTRVASTRNNNVKAFITTSPSTNISGLVAVSATSGLTGPVNVEFPDSIKVRVEDENGLPVPHVPVFFDVMEGGGLVSSPYDVGGVIRLEAEWGTPVSPFVKYSDNTASGGEYIASVQHGGEVRGYATYKFRVTTSGTYYYWGRVNNVAYPPTASRYVLGFELVGKDPVAGVTWEVLYNEHITGTWQWDNVQGGAGSSPHSHYLEPGLYTIKIWSAHRAVYFDKLIITQQDPSTWTPTGKEVVDMPVSNANGVAATAWTLGQTADDPATSAVDEGLNKVSAWTFASSSPVNFTAKALAGQPTQIFKDQDNVESMSGDTVALSITILDEFNNKSNNKKITFSVVQGDGVLIDGTESVLTDINGKAEASVRVGADDTTKVRANYKTGGPQVIMTIIVKEGIVGSISAAATDLSKLYVNREYKDSLEVEVRDKQGKPVTKSLPVQFVVTDALGTKVNGKSTTTVWTDLAGIAKASLQTGPRAGVAKITARTSGKTVSVLSDSVFYVGAHLTKPADHHDRQVLNVGQLAPDYIRVFMSDVGWNGVAGHPVTFQIADPSSGFTFEKGGTSCVDTTDAYGFAQAKVKAGQYHGAKETFENIVIASASDGFSAIPAPQKFTFFVRSDAYSLVRLSDDITGVAGEMVGPLRVQLKKANGDPLGNQLITFERITGNGSFNPETKLAKKIIQADGAGMATTNFWLGSYAGADSNKIRVYTENYNNIISCDFKLTAQSSVGDTLFALTPRVISGKVGTQQNIQVQISDVGQNPVPNEDVTFHILKGKNGAVGNGTADTLKVIKTNNSGIAIATWTLGTEAGNNSNRIEVTATNGSYTLHGSPLIITATTEPGNVSLALSTVDATGPIPVGPDSASTVTVVVHDTYGNPIPRKAVEIVVIGGENNFPPKQTVQTNDAGIASGKIYSTTAGQRTIKAVVDSDTLFEAAQLVYLAGDATELEAFAGDSQTGNVNTVLRKPFIVRVIDVDGNPVQYGPVYFNVAGNNGEMVEDMPIVTDANGYARAHFKMGARIGRYAAAQATSPNLQNSPTFWVTGKSGAAYSMWYPKGYNLDEMTGNAGEPSPLLTVQVLDADTLPVFGETVSFLVNPDEGSNGSIIGPSNVTTNEYGQASVRFKMDTRAGFESWVFAQNIHNTGKVWFKAISKAGAARKMSAVGNAVMPDEVIGETIVLKVRVTDAYGNPIDGVSVSFNKVIGQCEFVGASQVQTASGYAAVNVKLGDTAGEIKIQAVSGVEGSPVTFTITTKTTEQNASKLTRYPISQGMIAGTINNYLVDSIYVRVTDDYNNPVADQPVLFRVIPPLNGAFISGNGREKTNKQGIASVAFMCGSQPGVTHNVEARWGNKTVTIPIMTHYNLTAPVLDKNYIQSVYSGVEEGSDLWIELRGSDADGDNLTYEIGSLFPPAGAFIESNAALKKATFKWTPTYDQGRAEPYHVTLRVIDNKGMGDEKKVTIFVQNLNRLPQINAVLPESSEIAVTTGETHVFQVFASDPDGDDLTYTWVVDNVPVAATSSVYHHTVDKSLSAGMQTVDVFVSDGHFTSSNRWNLTVSDEVEMSFVTARFTEDNSSVNISWKTVKQVENVEFEVLRSNQQEGSYEKINSGPVQQSEEGLYVFIDRSVQVGRTYYYKVVSVDAAGNRTVLSPIMVNIPAPETFELLQNFPNPFNPVTTIRYTLPARDKVDLTIYNMVGQAVVTLVGESQNAGFYTVTWDGKDKSGNEVPTGIYIYRLQTKKFSKVHRMVKLR